MIGIYTSNIITLYQEGQVYFSVSTLQKNSFHSSTHNQQKLPERSYKAIKCGGLASKQYWVKMWPANINLTAGTFYRRCKLKEIFIVWWSDCFFQSFYMLSLPEEKPRFSVYREQVCVNLNPLWDRSGTEPCWITFNLGLILSFTIITLITAVEKKHGLKSPKSRAAQPNSAASLMPEASGKQPPPPPAAPFWGSTPRSNCWKKQTKQTNTCMIQPEQQWRRRRTRSWWQGVCSAPVLLHIYSYHTFYK